MKSDSSADLNKGSKFPIKAPISIGDLMLVSLDKSIVKSLGITNDTYFQQQQCLDGIYLRILEKDEFSSTNQYRTTKGGQFNLCQN